LCKILHDAVAAFLNLHRTSLQSQPAFAGYDVDTLANVSLLGVGYNTGSSCLHLAAQHGHLAMVERLLDAGASPKLADFRSLTLLCFNGQSGLCSSHSSPGLLVGGGRER